MQTYPVLTVSEYAPVQQPACAMIDNSINSLMVVNQQDLLVGIITEKDLVQRVIAQGSNCGLKAEDIIKKTTYYFKT